MDPLTPNQLLYTILVMLVVSSLLVGLLVVVMNRRYVTEQGKYGEVVPLWRHVLAELSGFLLHPHPWAAEMDALLKEANNEPTVHMAQERYERLIELLTERTKSTSPDLREWEREAAAFYLIALPFARREALSPIPETGLQLVSSKQPTEQTAEDAASAQVNAR